MRLIDADAALNEINGVFEIASNMAVLPVGVVKALIRNMLTLETITPTVSGWISMNDRMPETVGEEYIVYITSNDGEKCVTCDHWVKSSHERWFLFDDAEAVVTHWMPLPEPPEVNDG